MAGGLAAQWLLTAAFAGSALGMVPAMAAARAGGSRAGGSRAGGSRAARTPGPRRASAVLPAACLAVMCGAMIVMIWRPVAPVAAWPLAVAVGCAAVCRSVARTRQARDAAEPGRLPALRLPWLQDGLMAAGMIWMITVLPATVSMQSMTPMSSMPAAGPAGDTMAAIATAGPPAPVPVAVAVVSVLLAAYFAVAAIPWLLRAAGPGRRATGAAHAAMSAGMAAMLLAML